MKRISICIEYAGLTLPVVKNENGVEHVPLKPICELFALNWESQRVKLSNDPFYSPFLGVCTLVIRGAGEQDRSMVCIRLDRVSAFLMSLNPAKIRAAGNETGADYLQAKLTEWADALHDYESLGSAHNPQHAAALLALRRATAIANVARIKDPTLRSIALAELGIDGAAIKSHSQKNDLFHSQ